MTPELFEENTALVLRAWRGSQAQGHEGVHAGCHHSQIPLLPAASTRPRSDLPIQMSDLKGFSLRTKKSRRGHKESSKPSAPVPDVLDERSRHASKEKYETSGNSTDPRAAKSRERSKPGGATSDIIKKRYSIRYNQLPDFGQGDAPPLPGVPKLPQGYGQDGGRDTSPAQQDRGADLRALKDSSLRAEEGGFGCHTLLLMEDTDPVCSRQQLPFEGIGTGHRRIREATQEG